MDKELEKAIDQAGRGKVFALAQSNGWSTASTPPKWVWRQLISEVNSKRLERIDNASN